MKVKYLAHEWRHKSKAQLTKYTAGIKSSILNFPAEGDMRDLAKALVDGHTVVLGDLQYTPDDLEVLKSDAKKRVSVSSRHWRSQQVFALDFDNETEEGPLHPGDPLYISAREAISLGKAHGAPPAFVYTTYSHTDSSERFRMVFAADEDITDIHKRQRFLASLMEIFSKEGVCLVDTHCTDPSRLFYPGKALVYTSYDSITAVDKVLEIQPTFSLRAPSGAVNKNQDETPTGIHKTSTSILPHILSGDTASAKKVIAELLGQVSNHWQYLVRSMSTKGGTVTLTLYSILYYKKIIRDYCSTPSQQGQIHCDPTVLRDVPDSALEKALMKKVYLDSSDEYYQAVSAFPWHIAFEKELGAHFNCILPGHVDNNASARFESTHDGRYVYHCYGCQGVDQYHDIFNLLESLTGWSHKDSKKFINEILNLEFETEWQREKKEEITSFQDLLRTKAFRSNYPVLYKELIISRSFGLYDTLLSEARRMILDQVTTNSDDPIFFTGVRRLSMLMKENGVTEGISVPRIHTKLKYLQRLGLIIPLDNDSLPPEILYLANKARKAKDKKHKYRLSMYSLPPLGMNTFSEAEKIAEELLQFRVKRQDVSVQSELWRNDGENEVFVQDTKATFSKESLEFYNKCLLAADDLLKRGYLTEKELLAHKRLRSNKKKKELLAMVLPQLLKDKGLQITKFTKDYKTSLGINQGNLKFGLSNIIVPIDKESK